MGRSIPHLCRRGTLAAASVERNSPAAWSDGAFSVESHGPTSTVPSVGKGFAICFAALVLGDL